MFLFGRINLWTWIRNIKRYVQKKKNKNYNFEVSDSISDISDIFSMILFILYHSFFFNFIQFLSFIHYNYNSSLNKINTKENRNIEQSLILHIAI